MADQVDERTFMVRVAEQCERYDEMVEFLQELANLKTDEFTNEERNLISTGFKNQISNKRNAIRTIASIEQNP